MNHKKLVILAACLLTGCASTTAEFMLGSQVADGGFYPGHGVTATLRLRQRNQ